MCSSKRCGGLGLKRFEDWNRILGLKLIWLLFTSAGSLWVSWVRVNLIGTQNFWNLDFSQYGSWVWKSLCKIREDARLFVVCEVESGITANFWKDNWTMMGPLIEIVGETGPRIAGLSRESVVRDYITQGGWWLTSSRSRNPMLMLRQCLPSPEGI